MPRSLSAGARDERPRAMWELAVRTLRVIGFKNGSTKLLSFDDWYHLIRSVNRRMLLGNRVRRWPRRPSLPRAANPNPSDGTWKMALPALGAEHAHRSGGSRDELWALTRFFDWHVGADGRWLTPVMPVDHAMKGYSLLYLADLTTSTAYRLATEELAMALLERHSRAVDGALPYSLGAPDMLVDSLAMVSPFLARYAQRTGDEAARALAVMQLARFIEQGVDTETHLPYHGYYADGAKRLGLHGWGRGTGWYMLGLIDTLSELPDRGSDRTMLLEAFKAAADALYQHQRPDGHWHWAVPHHHDATDSSTTALVGYSLARALDLGLLPDGQFRAVVDRAISALRSATRSDGLVDGSLAECEGLGRYPQRYGPATWLQGATVAFAAVCLRLPLRGRG